MERLLLQTYEHKQADTIQQRIEGDYLSRLTVVYMFVYIVVYIFVYTCRA